MSLLEFQESDYHLQNKHKLFDLIVQGKVTLIDQNGIEYEIYPNKLDTEFLHIESPVVNYENNVLLSSNDLPCAKYLGLNKDKNRVLCNMQGSYGAFDKLPCWKCIFMNNDLISKNELGYRPDISWGFESKHKVWIEVDYMHSCTMRKIDFCKRNDIVLLEVKAYDIEKFNPKKSNKLSVMNLTSDYEKICKEKRNKIITEILNQLDENGYCYLNYIKDLMRENSIDTPENREDELNRILDQSNLINISHDYKKVFMELNDLEELEIGSIVISHDYYLDRLIPKMSIINDIKNRKRQEKIDKCINQLKCRIDEWGFHYSTIVRSELRKACGEWNYKKEFDNFIKDNNLKLVKISKKNSQIVRDKNIIRISLNGYNTILVTEEIYYQIKEYITQ